MLLRRVLSVLQAGMVTLGDLLIQAVQVRATLHLPEALAVDPSELPLRLLLYFLLIPGQLFTVSASVLQGSIDAHG